VSDLDLRDLPPPMPFQQALAAAEALHPGQTLVVLTPLWPWPLLEALEMRGLEWGCQPCADRGVRVSIHRPEARPLTQGGME
jgi:uncharacterized protein (DUF2249 family)